MEAICQKVKETMPKVLRAATSCLFHTPQVFNVAIKRCIDAQAEPVKEAILSLWAEIQIARTTRNIDRSFRRLKGMKNLKVHLGCGGQVMSGWVNIDLKGKLLANKDAVTGDTFYVQHDLRTGLPLEDNSCEFIYSSHFFEHLSYQHGLKLMHDCYRVLQPGGTFRIVLPNMREAFSRYLQGDNKYFELADIYRYHPEIEQGARSLVDYVNHAVYQLGQHKCIYDEEKLRLILQKIGYRSVAVSAFQEGIDSGKPLRRRYSFYMEAIK